MAMRHQQFRSEIDAHLCREEASENEHGEGDANVGKGKEGGFGDLAYKPSMPESRSGLRGIRLID